MLTGRSLMALGCVITGAVAMGILLALAAFGGLQIAAQVALATPTPTPDPATQPPRVVFSPVGEGYPAADSLQVAHEIDNARGPDGRDVVQGIIGNGRAVYLDNGTLVQVRQIDGDMLHVVVLTGRHRTVWGWLPTSVVQK